MCKRRKKLVVIELEEKDGVFRRKSFFKYLKDKLCAVMEGVWMLLKNFFRYDRPDTIIVSVMILAMFTLVYVLHGFAGILWALVYFAAYEIAFWTVFLFLLRNSFS